MNKKTILIGVLIILAVSAAAFIGKRSIFSVESYNDGARDRSMFTRGTQAEDTVIYITAEGFFPKEVTIKQGDIVTWVNDDLDFHWPASNLHPTHEIYSAFDPKEPIGKNETWSFTFEKVGEWRFHDHLKSRWQGIVRVEESK